MKPILNEDGTQKNPNISFSLSRTAMRLSSIRTDDWTQVIKDPAKYTNGRIS